MRQLAATSLQAAVGQHGGRTFECITPSAYVEYGYGYWPQWPRGVLDGGCGAELLQAAGASVCVC